MAAPSDSLRSLASERGGADARIVQSIREASRRSGVDFGYLLAQARQESGLRADAVASGSSATGLYQFVDRTWLDLVRRHGAQHGIGDLAQAIGTDQNGRPSVADPGLRRRILDLRNDPALSAAFAAEYARDNKVELERATGRPARGTDLYLAHFLGPGGAATFLRQAQEDGSASAAELLPDAAAANRGVFYDKAGEPRTVAEIYRRFAKKMEAVIGPEAPVSPLLPETAASGTSGPHLGGRAAGAAGLVVSGLSRLSQPVSAMLNVIAFSAMRILGARQDAEEDRRSTPL